MCILGFVLGLYAGLRQALGDCRAGLGPGASFGETTVMDYLIAGITSLGLFAYLIYALLRPEKF